MNEWVVVTVLITLFGFIAAIIKPILSLNSTIIKLSDSIKVLEKSLDTMNTEYETLRDKAEKFDEIQNLHEMRLDNIERRDGHG